MTSRRSARTPSSTPPWFGALRGAVPFDPSLDAAGGLGAGGGVGPPLRVAPGSAPLRSPEAGLSALFARGRTDGLACGW
jgi:hypothetical protein